MGRFSGSNDKGCTSIKLDSFFFIFLKLILIAEQIELLANANASQITLTGNAEAEKILAIGKSNAESYKLSVAAMGGNNFTRLKVMEAIGTQNIKIMPDILIGGGGDGANGPISGLPGLKLLELQRKKPVMKNNN